MRQYLLFLLLGLLGLCTSCNRQEGNGYPADVTISGSTLSPKQDGEVVLYRLDANGNRSQVAKTTTDADGQFELSLQVEHPGFYTLNVYNQHEQLLVVSDAALQVAPDKQGGYAITGSKDMQLLSEFQQQTQQVELKQAQQMEKLQHRYLQAQGNDSLLKALEREYQQVGEQGRQQMLTFAKKAKGSVVAILALQRLNPDKDLDLMYESTQWLEHTFPNSDIVVSFARDVDKLRRTAVGQPAPEIALPTPQGTSKSLSSLRGKVVLLDFWASWCGPCRAENPQVVALYDKYSPIGFDIFSVSLDKDAEAWAKAIEADNLKWPSHVSDLKFWQSEAAQAYNVTSIPMTYLLDKEGKIVAKGLRGPALEAEVRKLLGVKEVAPVVPVI